MIDTPKIIQTNEQLAAVIYQVVPRNQIKEAMEAALKELNEALGMQGISPTGPWFTHHMKRPDVNFDFEVGFPINQIVKASGRMKPGNLRATKVARTIYHGEYDKLGAGWGEFQKWIDEQGHESATDLWECYIVGPWTEKDPAKWQTELNRPLLES